MSDPATSITSHELHRRAGPLVGLVLRRFTPPDRVKSIREGMKTHAGEMCRALELRAMARALLLPGAQVDDRQTLEAKVLDLSGPWRAVHKPTREYQAAAQDVQPHDEFLHLALLVIAERRTFRRYLWRRFGFDVRRGRFLRWSRPVSDPGEAALLMNVAMVWTRAERVLLEGANALLIAHEERRTLDEAVARAALAMRMEFRQSGGLLVAASMTSKNARLREHATFSMAGWAASALRIRPRGDGKDNLRLLRALAAEGDDPAMVLRERLPGAVPLAWGERQPGEPLSGNLHTDGRKLSWRERSLLNRIAGLLETEGSEDRASALQPDLTPDRASEAALERFIAREDARAEIGRLAESAGLSPREREIFELMDVTDRSGEIAARLGIADGTVRNLQHKIRKKVRRAGRFA